MARSKTLQLDPERSRRRRASNRQAAKVYRNRRRTEWIALQRRVQALEAEVASLKQRVAGCACGAASESLVITPSSVLEGLLATLSPPA